MRGTQRLGTTDGDAGDAVGVPAWRAAGDIEWQQLIETLPQIVWVTRPDGDHIHFNQQWMDFTGLTLEESLGFGWNPPFHPDDRGRAAVRWEQAISTGQPYEIEYRLRRADGTYRWMLGRAMPLRDATGAVVKWFGTCTDIEDLKRAQAELEQSRALMQAAGRLATVGGWSLEHDRRRMYWSEETYRILDVPEGDVPPFDDLAGRFNVADLERIRGAVTRCLSDGTPFDIEVTVETFAGRHIPVRVTAEPQRAGDGQVTGVIGAMQDVSELRAASARTAEVARSLSTTLESMTDALLLLDGQWRVTFANSRAGHLLQRAPEDLVGRDIREEFPEAVGPQIDDLYRHAAASATMHRLEEYHYPPLDLWLDITAYPSEEGLALYFRDVSEQRAARAALRRREAMLERQAQLLDEAQDAIVVRDLGFQVTYWNRSAERVFGWTAADAIGTDERELLACDTGAFDAALATLLAHGSWNGELRTRTRDGGTVIVDARWTLVSDESDGPDAVLAIYTDVTQQRTIERQLLRAQRLESVGTLAGGIAHDLNNVLTPIMLAADLLQADAVDDDTTNMLDMIQASARRGAEMVSQVLSFARGADGVHTAIDVPALLTDIRAIVRDTFPKNIQTDFVLADELGTVVGDSTQIQQVLLNLAVNARDAMPDGGRLTLRASNETVDEPYAAATPGASPGAHIVIEVEDQGTGMPADVVDRIFDPFFTTKAVGAGTGLGLSTSAGIVRSHGGFIEVDSEPGRGSRFRLYLPASGEPPAVPEEPMAAHESAAGRGRTVLVVDDEDAVRAIASRTLEAHGYRTLEAADGAEAVSVFVQHRDRIDVVLTDMMMPVMDGPATIHALRRLDAALPIIASSGHGDKVAQAAAAGVRHFLDKPYSSRALREVLDDVLNGARSDP